MDVYRPSGRFDPASLLVGQVGALAGGVALAWVYQLFIDWVPIAYFACFATVVFGISVGVMSGQILLWSHCRNTAVTILVTACVALAAVAASHFCAYDRVVGELARRRGVDRTQVRKSFPITRYLEKKVEAGWKRSRGGGAPVEGVFVQVVWALEALVVLVLGVTTARSILDVPYCEDCQKWAEEETAGAKAGVSPDAIRDAVSRGAIDEIVSMRPDPAGPPNTVNYKLHVCNECLQLACLTVTRHWTETSSKGEVEQKSETLVSQVRVTQKQRDLLRDSLKGTTEPPPTEAPLV